MNFIYEPYPETVILNGRSRRIVTDFKDWLRFYDMLRDPELETVDKFEIICSFYLDPLVPADMDSLHKPLIDFFKMKYEEKDEEKPDSDKRSKPLYDFKFDAPYIISGFLRDYGIDITKVSMHWWKFRLLLEGLSSDTEFKQRVMYRNTDTGQIKDTAERRRIEKIKRAIAIPEPIPTDDEIGDLFW